MYQEAKEKMLNKVSEFLRLGSGWTFSKILALKIRITPYTPTGGKSYIPLPKKLANNGALINPKNDDEFCLK